jgi:hypothetical protein
MILFIFALLQLLCVVLDLFFFPSFTQSFHYWIDLSIISCIGGLLIFDTTSLYISTPFLLIKASFLPSSLLLLIVLSYLFFILFVLLLRAFFQIHISIVLVVVLFLLYPLYLLLLSRLIDISFLQSMIAQTVLFFAGMYPFLQMLHKKHPSVHRNHKALL